MNIRWCLAFIALMGCDPDPTPADSGTEPVDGGSDGAVSVCARDVDCDDELFCTLNRCRPGEDGAGANGCVIEPGPCATPSGCRETERSCDVECPDADGDGAQSAACGGDDCDDFDGNRFPGNAEVCDIERHDEDCVPDTLGDVDEDDDGAISAQCCNGLNCGPDCNDADPATSPTARES
ncbi:MAG: hypothetical protein AB8I08_06635 [Sandaracinaceae bacterium]